MKFYYLLKSDTSPGPYSLTELRQMQISREDLIKIGNSDWIPAFQHPEMQSWFNTGGGPAFTTNNTSDTSNPEISLQPKISKIKSKPKWIHWILIILVIIVVFFVVVTANMINSPNPTNVTIPEEIKPENPEIKFAVSQHDKKLFDFLKPCRITGDFKELIDRCDYTNSTTRNTVLGFISRENEGVFNLGQVCDIFDHIQSNWKYVNDPAKSEYVAFASESLQNGLAGDCDDFSVVLAAAILSVGGESRISYAFGPSGGHAFTEVNVGNTDNELIRAYIKWRYKDDSEIHYKTDAVGNKWLNLDWSSQPQRPGGKYFQYTDGQRFFISAGYCEEITD